MDLLLEATHRRSRLSLQDRLCLLTAREWGWVCVTNDKALRRACEEDGVPVLWGLELMLRLIHLGKLERHRAVALARAIQRSNPFYITEQVLERFVDAVRAKG